MSGKKVLLSFVGNHDPFSDEEGTPGPVLSLLEVRSFDTVYLLWTAASYLETANMVASECACRSPGPVFKFLPMELTRVTDYDEIYGRMLKIIQHIKENEPTEQVEYSILLDPGTPQMQTCWFLLVRSGTFPAVLLQGVPPRFTGGVYKVREVTTESDVLPKIERIDALRPKGLKDTPFQVLASRSRATEEVYALASQYSLYDLSILIQGESGTGKEVLARFIHEKSPFAENPFLTVNCAGLNPELTDSTLFGHKKGSFTGATTDRIGHFKAADGGTLFLDELGDLPVAVQPKLLRALEYKTFMPLGASVEESAQVRIISATNKDLKAMIEAGTFREDLFQRLNQAPLLLPPLRERREDIPILIETFLTEWEKQYQTSKRLSSETLTFLLDYPWPGNIRELRNIIFRLCAVSLADEIYPEHLPPEIRGIIGKKLKPEEAVRIPDEGLDLKALLFTIEEDYYRKALEKAGGNRERAAGFLGLKPHTYRKSLKERFGVE